MRKLCCGLLLLMTGACFGGYDSRWGQSAAVQRQYAATHAPTLRALPRASQSFHDLGVGDLPGRYVVLRSPSSAMAHDAVEPTRHECERLMQLSTGKP